MAPIRFEEREEKSSAGVLILAAGAIAGVLAGVYLAQRFGGISGLRSSLERRMGRGAAGKEGTDARHPAYDADYGEDDAEDADDSADEELEERVLEAFRNDPILSERAIDIGAIGDGIIELTGWVRAESESPHAVTVARGVPGVTTVVNRLVVREQEERLGDAARRRADGDPALTEARWEGQRVGTGRRRQGTSSEIDRHADPKPNLEERWLGEEAALREAAEDVDVAAERRSSSKKTPKNGDRTGGAPIAPTGVPKGDHVADPLSDETRAVLKEQTGRDTLRAD